MLGTKDRRPNLKSVVVVSFVAQFGRHITYSLPARVSVAKHASTEVCVIAKHASTVVGVIVKLASHGY